MLLVSIFCFWFGLQESWRECLFLVNHPCQVHSPSFFIKITHVLSNFDYDASSIIFARRVNYDYYLIKFAKVAIFVGVLYWPP